MAGTRGGGGEERCMHLQGTFEMEQRIVEKINELLCLTVEDDEPNVNVLLKGHMVVLALIKMYQFFFGPRPYFSPNFTKIHLIIFEKSC